MNLDTVHKTKSDKSVQQNISCFMVIYFSSVRVGDRAQSLIRHRCSLVRGFAHVNLETSDGNDLLDALSK